MKTLDACTATRDRTHRRPLGALVLGLLLMATTAAAQDNQPIPGIGPVGEITKLHTGFKFTEGPAADRDGNVYFTDIPTNRILKTDTEGKLSTFLEDSKGCNGLMFDGKGRLIACQGGEGRIIAIDVATKKIDVLAAEYNGKRFNRPNDLVVDRQGGVYFTDPSFAKAEPAQDKMGVYYVAPGGQATRLIDDLERPNGVILSPDEKTLYVLISGKPGLMAYPVQAPGKIGTGKLLGQVKSGGDGLTVDTKGNLYLTQPSLSAIQVITPQGETLGMIKFPEGPSNCTFGGKDMKTLFVTARTSLYTVKTDATGHRFALAPTGASAASQE
jgi:gluconolactonase